MKNGDPYRLILTLGSHYPVSSSNTSDIKIGQLMDFESFMVKLGLLFTNRRGI